MKVEDNFLLEVIATCYGKQSDLVMYFKLILHLCIIVTTWPMHYIFIFTRLDNTWTGPTNFITIFNFNSKLLEAPKTLKDFVYQYKQKKEILDKCEN